MTQESEHVSSRREFLGKAGKAAAVPAVAMLISSSVIPTAAQAGYKPCHPGKPGKPTFHKPSKPSFHKPSAPTFHKTSFHGHKH